MWEQLQGILWELRWVCDDLAVMRTSVDAQARRVEHLRWSPNHLSTCAGSRPRPVDTLLCTYQRLAQEEAARLSELRHEAAAWYAWTAGRALLAAVGVVELEMEDLNQWSPDWECRWRRDRVPPLPAEEDWGGHSIGRDPYLKRARRVVYEKSGVSKEELTEALLCYGDKAADLLGELHRRCRTIEGAAHAADVIPFDAAEWDHTADRGIRRQGW